MSRQFDEYMEDKFEYNGELCSLVCPASFPELIEALGVKNTLQGTSKNSTVENYGFEYFLVSEIFPLICAWNVSDFQVLFL